MGIPNALPEADWREVGMKKKKRPYKVKETVTGDGAVRKKQKEGTATPCGVSVARSTDSMMMDGSGGPRGQSRTATPGSPAPTGPILTPVPLQPKKKRERPFKTPTVKYEPGLAAINAPRDLLAAEVALAATEHIEQEIHPPTYRMLSSYVSPPQNAIIPPLEGTRASPSHDAALTLALHREGQIDETDAYSAYAFGGPRNTPPYRQLYRIQQPDPGDCSGWAENLRWVLEQNTLFRLPHRPDAWNESPEHMERIVEIRREQGWMSEQLREMNGAG
jgi:hypothetical protein